MLFNIYNSVYTYIAYKYKKAACSLYCILMAHCSSPNAAFSALPTRGRPKTSVCIFCNQTHKGVALQGSATSSVRRSQNMKTPQILQSDQIHKPLQMQITKRHMTAASRLKDSRAVPRLGLLPPLEGRLRRRGMGWLVARLLCVLHPQLSLQTDCSHINKETLFHASTLATGGSMREVSERATGKSARGPQLLIG